jgi:sec-independent protein translocase protein TatA
MGNIGIWNILVILLIFLLLFGAKKLPELAKGLGGGIREFKKAAKEVEDELTTDKSVAASEQAANDNK